jgi:hypothetical protein
MYQIWGCERAVARSHPQIWGSTTVIPKDPLTALLFVQSCYSKIIGIAPA